VRRADLQGSVSVLVAVTAIVNDGASGNFAERVESSITINDGAAASIKQVYFLGANVISVQAVSIISSNPATYTF